MRGSPVEQSLDLINYIWDITSSRFTGREPGKKNPLISLFSLIVSSRSLKVQDITDMVHSC
jgi:hypothetical protein